MSASLKWFLLRLNEQYVEDGLELPTLATGAKALSDMPDVAFGYLGEDREQLEEEIFGLMSEYGEDEPLTGFFTKFEMLQLQYPAVHPAYN